MPDYIPGDPNHPGSPCLFEADGNEPFEWDIICLTCGRTNLSPEEPPWWMWWWSRDHPKAIEA